MSGPGHVLGAIGHTPLVALRRVVPAGAARVVLKLESANPTGSMKDRVARAMLEAAGAGAGRGAEPGAARAARRPPRKRKEI